jgi:predicted ABC-class ATPase
MIVIKGHVNAPAVAALAMSTPRRLPRSFVFHVERVILFEPSIVVILRAFRDAELYKSKREEEKKNK